MALTGASMPKMATNHICIAMPSQSPTSLQDGISCQEESGYLASHSYRYAIRVRHAIRPSDEDNVIAALEHPDRVCRFNLSVTGSELGKISTVMQEPFPVLTHLSISSKVGPTFVPLSGFLAGFAPCLQKLDLRGIAFPSLPTLLLSAINLVELNLCGMPPAGYISPDAKVAHLAALPRLKTLDIGFHFYSDIITFPTIRSVLPSLQSLSFTGYFQYLEDFVARINTPQLDSIAIYYWDQDIEFAVPQLSIFVNRSECLKQILSGHCQITVDQDAIVDCRIGGPSHDETKRRGRQTGISVCILCEGVDEQISHLADIICWMFPLLSDVVHFTIDSILSISESQRTSEAEELDDIVWLLLLLRFPSVRTLFVSDKMEGLISQALGCVYKEMVTDILPALQLFCVEEDEDEEHEDEDEDKEDRPMLSVHKFVTACQDYGRPVTFVKIKHEFEERLKSYL
jgi:hypothetical protein